MNFQPINHLAMPCDKHAVTGGVAPATRIEIRWNSHVTRKDASRTAGFVIG